MGHSPDKQGNLIFTRSFGQGQAFGGKAPCGQIDSFQQESVTSDGPFQFSIVSYLVRWVDTSFHLVGGLRSQQVEQWLAKSHCGFKAGKQPL